MSTIKFNAIAAICNENQGIGKKNDFDVKKAEERR
jgi:hypothetical protein